MTPPRRLTPKFTSLALVVLGSLLAGCISLLPKEKPSQLYRFGASAPPAARPGAAAGQFSVSAAPMNFVQAAAGDQILTITGDQAAFIGGSRWVTAADTLFEAAVSRAFDADVGPARLIPRGEAVRSDYLLKLDVRAFEARYDHGQTEPPTVVVEVYAGLIKRSSELTSAPPADRIFTASVPASENRAGAIAQAFDVAVTKVLKEIVAWVDAKGA